MRDPGNEVGRADKKFAEEAVKAKERPTTCAFAALIIPMKPTEKLEMADG